MLRDEVNNLGHGTISHHFEQLILIVGKKSLIAQNIPIQSLTKS